MFKTKFKIRIFYCDSKNPEDHLKGVGPNIPFSCDLTKSLSAVGRWAFLFKILKLWKNQKSEYSIVIKKMLIII